MRDNMDEAVRARLSGRDAVETCLVEDAGAGACYCSEFWLLEDGALAPQLVCD